VRRRLFAGIEPSAQVGFAGNRIDRQSEARDDDAAAAALAEPGAQLMLLSAGRVLLSFAGAVAQPWWTPSSAAPLGPVIDDAVLLGRLDGKPMLAVPAGVAPESLPAGVKAIDFRSVYVQGLIDATALGALAQGAALSAWHQANRFCGRCGGATVARGGGVRRVCSACAAEHFPRTDPVAIMLAVRGERCLLGRGRHFPPGMVSCLAGFIEPGETIEAAVRREVLEESGIRIRRVAYHASQPWPFPHSLMIGCFAEARSAVVRFDERELEACRWFSRDETLALLAGRHGDGLSVPPPGAIATHLIRAWAEGPRGRRGGA